MKRKIDKELTLLYFRYYPHHIHKRENSRAHQVLLGIGGNIGDVPRRFDRLYHFLVKSPFITIVETSPILRNPPFGYLEQEDFYNAVIAIRTHLGPQELLWYLLRVEKRFGRKRTVANGPRTLDIDILFFDNRKINRPELTVPHPGWRSRESVLIPMSYMKGLTWLKRPLLRQIPKRHLSWRKKSTSISVT